MRNRGHDQRISTGKSDKIIGRKYEIEVEIGVLRFESGKNKLLFFSCLVYPKMAIKKTIQLGNPILAKKAKSIQDIHALEIKKTIKNLVDSMRANNLIGMAAPQIGVSQKIFVIEIRKTKFRKTKDADALKIFINPKITRTSKARCILYEGCGSVAYSQLFGPVKRPSTVIIEAYDEHGEKIVLKATGLLARVIQHEYDHLDGICFIEKITDIKKLVSDEEYMNGR